MFPTLSWAALAAALVQQPQAPRDSTQLDEIVVTASRATANPRIRTQSADALSGEELARRGITRLAAALRQIAGVGLVASGAPGGVASAFMRGVNSNQTLILVDGIRVSDANLPPGSLLGGFDLTPQDRVEVVRGPQSTLYGGAAIGGVIAVGGDERRAPVAGVRVSAGSFNTWRSDVVGRVNAGRLTLTGAAALIDTDNQRPDNQYDQRSQALRIGLAASDRLALGATFRGLQQSYTSPGDVRSTNTTPVGVTTFENHLATAYGELLVTDRWTSRLTAGLQDYYLSGTSRFNGGPPFVSRLEATRRVLDWGHRVRAGERVSAAAGLNAEWTTVTDGNGQREERLRAAYGEVAITPYATTAITAGIRADDYSTFGGAVTGRVGASYFLAGPGIRLRASIGSGFLPPSLAARFGGTFQRPNPDIRPERSTGWDAGADLQVAGGRGLVSATAFANRIRDLIGFESAPFPQLGRSVNIARAKTRGVEVSGRVATGSFDVRAGYTYLHAEAPDEPDPAARRLIRRPAHSVSGDVHWAMGSRVELGAGLVAALDREDTDFNRFPFVRVNPGDYVDAGVRGAIRLSRSWRVRGALENLFDERYEEAYGFPALGRRVSVGLEARW